MPRVFFAKGHAPVNVAEGDNLMQSLLAAGRPVGSSCGGEGVCTKCLIEIVSGFENLSKPNELEIKLREQHSIDSRYRVSCQTRILGDIKVDADYW